MLNTISLSDTRRGFKHDGIHMPNENEVKKEEVVIDPTIEPVEDDTTPSSTLPVNQDYEAIAQEEQARSVRAAIAFKEREAKRDDEIPEEQIEGDKPITRRDLEEILSAQQKVSNKDRIASIAKSIAGSEAEASAIVATFNNRTFPTNLSLEEQLREAKAIVTHKVVAAKNQELARALKARDSIQDNPAGTHRDPPASTEPKMSAADAQGIKSAGYVWDGQKQVWRKKLGNGKFLVMKSLKTPAWIE